MGVIGILATVYVLASTNKAQHPAQMILHVAFELRPQLARGLVALALREGTTRFTTTLAAHPALSYRQGR
jgi:hypothetical protein